MSQPVHPYLSRRRTAAALFTAALLAVLAGCASGSQADMVTSAVPVAGSTAASSTGSVRIVLRFDEEVLPATLVADTAPGRQLVAMLPLAVELRDPMGQAKSGPLPVRLDTANAETVTDPAVGDIYYRPDSAMIAIFYDDLGQTVPPPGLVRLGNVRGDVRRLAAAGNRISLRIDPVDGYRP